MSEVTRLLNDAARGHGHASAELLPLVYDELRRLARAQLAGERAGHTLQPTALVHEAYLRLVGAPGGPDAGAVGRWDGRPHFFAAAGQAMRRILIDDARRRQAVRHGGGLRRADLAAADDAPAAAAAPYGISPEDALALDEALTRLAAEDAGLARLVELRFFAGLGEAEAAEVLGISRATAARQWGYARAWLRDAIDGNANP